MSRTVSHPKLINSKQNPKSNYYKCGFTIMAPNKQKKRALNKMPCDPAMVSKWAKTPILPKLLVYNKISRNG